MIRDTLRSLRVDRLAFPSRSAALATLVDSPQEAAALDALRSVTAPIGDDPWSFVQAPFAYPTVSRFSDGTHGVLYTANSLITAIRESAYHLGRIYADGRAPAMETRRVHLSLRLAGTVVDVRRRADPSVDPAIYDPDAYARAQAFGAQVRSAASGLHYDSVRNPAGGHCVGAFVPTLVRSVRIAGACALVWDGQRFVEAHDIRPL